MPETDPNVIRATDLERVEQKIDALASQVADLHRSQQMLASLYEEMMPIAMSAMHTASVRLAELEEKGYFDFARESMHVLDNIVRGFTPDDVHALAENVVTILDTVKRATQPEVLQFATHTADALEDEAERKPKGVISMMRHGAKDEDVRRGLAVAMEALRQIGRSADPERQATRAKWGAAVAAKRAPPPSPSPSSSSSSSPSPSPSPSPEAKFAPKVQAPAPAPVEPAGTVAGLAVDAEGFLVDPESWTEDYAREAAAMLGVALTERHWEVLNFVRAEYLGVGGAPNIRRITIGAGIQTKDLFTLFPRAPAKTAARIAGVKKPVGCI